MEIYFVRHGQSQFNAAFKGEVDPLIYDAPLTELGFSQAAEARNRFSKNENHAGNHVATAPCNSNR